MLYSEKEESLPQISAGVEESSETSNYSEKQRELLQIVAYLADSWDSSHGWSKDTELLRIVENLYSEKEEAPPQMSAEDQGASEPSLSNQPEMEYLENDKDHPQTAGSEALA